MDDIEALKKKGNEAYSKLRFEKACTLYGQCLEAMIHAENLKCNVCASEEFCKLKYVVFLNLAISNLKLGASEGCRRCCNAALVFCNNSTLELKDLGIDDDLTRDVELREKLLPSVVPYAAKSLYRRGQSYVNDGQNELALRDVSLAFRLVPSDAAIAQLLDDLTTKASSDETKIDSSSHLNKIDDARYSQCLFGCLEMHSL